MNTTFMHNFFISDWYCIFLFIHPNPSNYYTESLYFDFFCDTSSEQKQCPETLGSDKPSLSPYLTPYTIRILQKSLRLF